MTLIRARESLQNLGLTSIEAKVYIYLLQHGSTTGYGVGKGLGIPAANVYRSLETLHAKGAVILEDGLRRLCRAVPLEELLASLDRQFSRFKENVQRDLAQLKAPPIDHHVYHLISPKAVFERFYQMLEMASAVVLMDLFPKAANELRNHIEATAKRGVRVMVKLYEPLTISGVQVILDSKSKTKFHRWAGVWANGVIDGTQYLLAYLSEDMRQVHQAIWTDNVYASWIYHSALAYELLWSHSTASVENRELRNELKRIEREFIDASVENAPGYKKLIELYGSEV